MGDVKKTESIHIAPEGEIQEKINTQPQKKQTKKEVDTQGIIATITIGGKCVK